MNNRGGKRDGAGRPKTGKNTEQFCITLSKDQAKKLKEKAAMYNVSLSKVIIDGLDLEPEPYTVNNKENK